MSTDLQMLMFNALIWRCSCNDLVNKLPNYLLQQFIHCFILIYTLGLTIYLKIRQNRSASQPQCLEKLVFLTVTIMITTN